MNVIILTVIMEARTKAIPHPHPRTKMICVREVPLPPTILSAYFKLGVILPVKHSQFIYNSIWEEEDNGNFNENANAMRLGISSLAIGSS